MKILLAVLLFAGCSHPLAQPAGGAYPVSDPCRGQQAAEDAAAERMTAAVGTSNEAAAMTAFDVAHGLYLDCLNAN